MLCSIIYEMPSNFESFEIQAEPAGFNLFSHTHSTLFEEISRKVDEGLLPADTFLRLGCIGHSQKEPDGALTMQQMLEELNTHADNTDGLSERSRSLFYGNLPGALLDWNGSEFIDRLAQQPEMYYRKAHLTEVIRLRREYEGKTIIEPRMDSRLRKESSVCKGLAHGVWRALLREARPEWIDVKNLQAYYQPAIYNGSVTFNLEPQEMRRRIVSVAIFNHSLVAQMYERAQTSGISGLGRTGITDIASMLAEEDPEYFQN
jgi:hypothetical protein